MKATYFQCPHCGQPITPPEIPPDIAAAAFSSRRSPAMAEASRRNAKLPRKRPVNPDTQTNPEPEAPELRKAGLAVTSVADAKAVALNSLTLAEARAKALELMPLVAGRARDYSTAYS